MRGDIHDPELNRLSITVGEVRCSPDLKIATAFVMPLGGEAQGEAIEFLARNKAELRRIIGRKAGLKFTPDLRFRLDETFDQMDETRRLFEDEKVRRDVEGRATRCARLTPRATISACFSTIPAAIRSSAALPMSSGCWRIRASASPSP